MKFNLTFAKKIQYYIIPEYVKYTFSSFIVSYLEMMIFYWKCSVLSLEHCQKFSFVNICVLNLNLADSQGFM